MYICNCRGVSEKTFIAKLKDLKNTFIYTKRRGDHRQPEGTMNLDELHESCSDGAGFQCGKCVCDIKKIAQQHNEALIQEQNGNMVKDGPNTASVVLRPANDPVVPAVKKNTPLPRLGS